MIGGALRLAGMAGKALLSPGVGGQVARGVAGTGALIAAPSVYDSTLGGGTRRAQDEILATQRPVGDEGYDIDLGNRLRSTINQAFGGKGITQETLGNRKDAINLQKIEDDAELTARLAELGVTPKAGDTVAGLTAKHGKEIKKLARTEGIRDAIAEAEALATYQRSTPEYIREQARIEEDRAYRRRQDKLTRQDSIDARQAQLDLGMAELAFKEADAQRAHNRLLKADKRERMAALLAGLGSLGGAFAI